MPIESCFLVGPMLPATNRGLSGFLRVNSSAARRASSAAVLFSSNDVFLEPELLERDRRAVEGVGLDDVGAGLEVGAMDVLDDLGLGEHQGLGAVLDAEPDAVANRWPRKSSSLS